MQNTKNIIAPNKKVFREPFLPVMNYVNRVAFSTDIFSEAQIEKKKKLLRVSSYFDKNLTCVAKMPR